jgi:hypothetical protein
VNQEQVSRMENAKTVEYVSYQLELKKEMKLAQEALAHNDYKQAMEHCINMQVEVKMLTNAVSTWIKEK